MNHLIEDLLDIQIFSTMNTLLKDKVNENKTTIKDNDYNIDLAQEKIKMQEQYIADIKNNADKRINEAKIKISKAESEKETYNYIVTELQEEVNNLQEDILDFDTITKKKNKIEKLEYKLQEKIKKLEHEIEFYQDHDNCPVCKQDIEDDFKHQTIEDKQSSLVETTDGFQQLRDEWIIPHLVSCFFLNTGVLLFIFLKLFISLLSISLLVSHFAFLTFLIIILRFCFF